jgi:hypothetical protein
MGASDQLDPQVGLTPEGPSSDLHVTVGTWAWAKYGGTYL